MKKFLVLLILVVATISFTSCEKEDVKPDYNTIAEQYVYSMSQDYEEQKLLSADSSKCQKLNNNDIKVTVYMTLQRLDDKSIYTDNIYVYFTNGDPNRIYLGI